MAKDKRIDAYIANAPEYAQPILKRIRELVHAAVPDVEETIKWRHPAFDYQGSMCMMVAFKNYAMLSFWKGKIMADPAGMMLLDDRDAVGYLGQWASVKDMPTDKVIKQYVKEAARINKEGIKLPARPKKDAAELVVPDYFTKALNKNKKAKQVFEGFSYSHKKEYLEWITDAKTEPTRDKRIAQALEWIAEGKGRNWKYQKK